MTRRLPPLKALPAFEIAAQRLSFSEAAAEMHLTHGAISRQIKSLESYFGAALFRRFNRGIELTESGASLLSAVRAALDVIEVSAAQVSVQPRKGPLTISCLPTLMMRWLIPRLYDLAERQPCIEVRLAASSAPVDFGLNGIDIAIRVATAAPRRTGVEARPFLEERIGPVCSPTILKLHPLQRAADLRHHTLLHTDTRPDAWLQWSRRFGVKALDAGMGPRFEHFYYLLEAAAGGLGVALAPHPLVEQDLKSGRLVAPLGFVPSDRSYYLLYSKKLANTQRIRAFRSWIAEVAREETRRQPSSSVAPRLPE